MKSIKTNKAAVFIISLMAVAIIISSFKKASVLTSVSNKPYAERNLTTAEYQFALSIFEREFAPKDMITITSGTGLGGRPYVRPSINGGVQINIGNIYNNPLATDASKGLFAHELTHAWQIEHYGLLWYSRQALHNQVIDGEPYDYICNEKKTLGVYIAEQQGEIVKHYYLKNACATAVARPLRSATWKLLTGSDAVDMAVASNGTYYMINAAGIIYNYDAAVTEWKKMPGSAGKAIAANAGKVCMVNSVGKIYELAGATWKQMPGSAAKDIAIDVDGTIWMVNTIGKIYKYTGTNWKQMPGSDAAHIAAGSGQVWMVNRVGKIYKYNGTAFTQMPGSAGLKITVANDGNVFLTNITGKIYQLNGNIWTQLDGSDGRAVDANKNKLVMINRKSRMYFRIY